MDSTYQSLSHSKWDCKYHVVFVPKYRRKALYGEIRKQLGPIFHELASLENTSGRVGTRSRPLDSTKRRFVVTSATRTILMKVAAFDIR